MLWFDQYLYSLQALNNFLHSKFSFSTFIAPSQSLKYVKVGNDLIIFNSASLYKLMECGLHMRTLYRYVRYGNISCFMHSITGKHLPRYKKNMPFVKERQKQSKKEAPATWHTVTESKHPAFYLTRMTNTLYLTLETMYKLFNIQTCRTGPIRIVSWCMQHVLNIICISAVAFHEVSGCSQLCTKHQKGICGSLMSRLVKCKHTFTKKDRFVS